jgi:hypothetical protein
MEDSKVTMTNLTYKTYKGEIKGLEQLAQQPVVSEGSTVEEPKVYPDEKKATGKPNSSFRWMAATLVSKQHHSRTGRRTTRGRWSSFAPYRQVGHFYQERGCLDYREPHYGGRR